MKEEFVQLYKKGPLWATKNIGANIPTEEGKLFAWGDTEGVSVTKKKLKGYVFLDSPYNGMSREELQEEGVLNGIHLSEKSDTATILLGEHYRMPTGNELKKLIEKCRWEFVRDDSPYYIVHGEGEFSENFIILPYGAEPLYWSSTSGTKDTDARGISYHWSRAGNLSCGNHDRDWGMMIRPVKRIKTELI